MDKSEAIKRSMTVLADLVENISRSCCCPEFVPVRKELIDHAISLLSEHIGEQMSPKPSPVAEPFIPTRLVPVGERVPEFDDSVKPIEIDLSEEKTVKPLNETHSWMSIKDSEAILHLEDVKKELLKKKSDGKKIATKIAKIKDLTSGTRLSKINKTAEELSQGKPPEGSAQAEYKDVKEGIKRVRTTKELQESKKAPKKKATRSRPRKKTSKKHVAKKL